MSELAKQVLSGCYARANELRAETRPVAETLLAQQEEQQTQSGFPRPAWKENYMKPEQPPVEE